MENIDFIMVWDVYLDFNKIKQWKSQSISVLLRLNHYVTALFCTLA